MAEWQVTGQEQTTGRLANGSYGPVVEVAFTVDGAGPFKVVVPASDYSAETVRSLIEARAEQVAAVASLRPNSGS